MMLKACLKRRFENPAHRQAQAHPRFPLKNEDDDEKEPKNDGGTIHFQTRAERFVIGGRQQPVMPERFQTCGN